jgi:phospholipid-translocating ATPase
MGLTVSKENRSISLDGATLPKTFPTNQLNNQKYNLLSFLPKLLYNEFKYFFNMFFLLTALSQFVPSLKVGLLVTYVAPLVFVLTVTMLKEAYDDF